jgi:uncharacterized protein YidB (DUF937 family)
MGLLDDLMSAAGASDAPTGSGGTFDAQHEAMAKAVMAMVGQQGPGGLEALAQGFQQGGIGDLMSSWIGGGPNLPATPSHIEQGMGGNMLNELAAKVGVSPQMASTLLAVVLPLVINRLTPQGRIPAQNDLGGMLGSLLGSGAASGMGGVLGGLLGGRKV